MAYHNAIVARNAGKLCLAKTSTDSTLLDNSYINVCYFIQKGAQKEFISKISVGDAPQKKKKTCSPTDYRSLQLVHLGHEQLSR